jgi:hypothetical protein
MKHQTVIPRAVAGAAMFLTAITGVANEPSALRRVVFTEDTGVIRNPGQGWTAERWAFQRADPLVNIGALYGRFNWGNLEPEEGVYDWSRIDALVDLAVSQGIPASFRILCVSDCSSSGWSTPKWVFDKGAKDEPFLSYVDIGGKRTAVLQHTPLFDDPVFMAEHRRFLGALAARYDADPRIAGIDIGSYGHWGEWHCYGLPPCTNRFDSSGALVPGPWVPPRVYPIEIRRQYADWYLENFRKTPLAFMTDDWEVFQYALGDGDVPRVGLRRDGVGSPHHFTRWIGTKPYDAIPRMVDVWRDRPVWFEFYCPARQFKTKGWSIEQSVEWMLTNHVSTVNTTPFSPWEIGDDPDIFALLRKIDLYAGARFVPKEADVWRKGRQVGVRLAGVNRGVARIFLPYALEIVASDNDGKERFVHESAVDPGTWLPGEFGFTERFELPPELADKPMRLSVRLRHCGGIFRNFRFAALESAEDGTLPLGEVKP